MKVQWDELISREKLQALTMDIWNYMDGSERDNSLALYICGFTFFYSYNTIVAYRAPGEGLIVSENIWSKTTGKHINNIIGGRDIPKIPHEEFSTRLNSLLSRLNVVVIDE